MTKLQREERISNNIALVAYVVDKITKGSIATPYFDKEDMISVGVEGLISAVDTFNPSKGYKFSTYASVCIRNSVLMFLRKNSRYLKVSYLEEPILIQGDYSEPVLLKDTVRCNDAGFDQVLEGPYIKYVVKIINKNLSDLEREVLKLRIFKEYTQSEVGRLLGLNQSYISRLEKKMYDKCARAIRSKTEGKQIV